MFDCFCHVLIFTRYHWPGIQINAKIDFDLCLMRLLYTYKSNFSMYKIMQNKQQFPNEKQENFKRENKCLSLIA